jgi:hypothetical protein
VRLGRLPTSPATLASAPAHRFGAVPPPPVLNRSHVNFTPELYRNDTLPNCTAVSYANAARAIAALNGFGLIVDQAKVVQFYSDCVGNPPDLAATDGAVLADVLLHQARHQVDIGPQSLVANYGTVDHTSRTALANGMVRLGSVYLGVTLRDRDMQTVGGVWDVVDGRDDGPIVGGHCVIGFDYTGLRDADTVRIGTWGTWQATSWRWLAARLDEGWAMVWRELARADGRFYSGLTADGLVAEL